MRGFAGLFAAHCAGNVSAFVDCVNAEHCEIPSWLAEPPPHAGAARVQLRLRFLSKHADSIDLLKGFFRQAEG